MMKTILHFVGACALGISASVLAVEVKPDHPDTYVVKRGDTLWDISGKFLNQPWEWPELWEINPQIEDPHWIYPGDVLSLVYVDGKPRLRVTPGNGRTVKFGKGDTVKLSPEIRSTPIESPIPAIPLSAIKGFLSGHRVVEEDEVKNSPYVLAGDEQHIVMGLGDTLYARGDWAQPHQNYGVYRDGITFTDPDSKEFLGFGILDVGAARFESAEEDVAKLRVSESRLDIRVGDRLIPSQEEKLQSVFNPRSPARDINGHIIHVFEGVANVSQYDVVALDRGERDGLAVGDVLSIMGRGEVVRDDKTQELVKLPDERRGVLIVFRTFEKVSYGLILRASSPIRLGDQVKNPS